MTQFASKQYEGRTYTFEHLQPMNISLQLNIKGRQHPHRLDIDVTFGCHCFTETFVEGTHGAHHRYTHEGELRAFEPLRYECSLQLPQVMNSIEGGLIYRSDQSYTYVARITVRSEGRPQDYSVFFSLNRPARNREEPASRLMMYVKSAYLAPLKAKGKNARNWRFKGLVSEVAGI